MYAANFRSFDMSSFSLKTGLHPSWNSCPSSSKQILILFQEINFIHSYFFFYCMYLINMPFQIVFSDSFKCTLTSVQTHLFGWYSWNFYWRRLMCSCVRSILLRPERSLFKYQLDPLVFYLLTFFQMVILVGENLSRKRCSKSCWTSLKVLVLK